MWIPKGAALIRGWPLFEARRLLPIITGVDNVFLFCFLFVYFAIDNVVGFELIYATGLLISALILHMFWYFINETCFRQYQVSKNNGI